MVMSCFCLDLCLMQHHGSVWTKMESVTASEKSLLCFVCLCVLVTDRTEINGSAASVCPAVLLSGVPQPRAASANSLITLTQSWRRAAKNNPRQRHSAPHS